MRFKALICSLLVVLTLPAQALEKPHIQTTTNTGIVFIHGTSDHRDNALGGYWKPKLVNTIVNALPNKDNYLIVHCDFRSYMWQQQAASCTAGQISTFIKAKNIDDLLVITHSDGANVMRWIMSNPSYDSRYPEIINKVRWVDAIAPSSLGTYLADLANDGTVFEEAVGWLLGYHSDAVKQQRVGDMAIYNATLLKGTDGTASLPKPFYSIIGTDVSASPINSNNYCGGYRLNLGLKVTKLYLDKCADGFLNCSSQAGAGQVWFYDKDKTANKEELNHNQSRNDCFGLSEIIASDL